MYERRRPGLVNVVVSTLGLVVFVVWCVHHRRVEKQQTYIRCSIHPDADFQLRVMQ